MKVWQIAAQLIDPLAKLETIGLAHSDIRPSSIFVKQDAVLLAEPSVIPGLGSAYQRAIDGDKPYLSPQ
jgi:serine/threonine protein kinase